MAKFPEAEARLFKNKYICLKCGAKNTFDRKRIRHGNANCRECGYTRFRPKSKEK